MTREQAVAIVQRYLEQRPYWPKELKEALEALVNLSYVKNSQNE